MRALRTSAVVFGLLCIALASRVAAADKYPDRPIHWVVGFTAGGPNDIVARILGEWIGNYLADPKMKERIRGELGGEPMPSRPRSSAN